MSSDIQKKKVSISKQFASVHKISILGIVSDMSALGLNHYASDYLSAAKAINCDENHLNPARSYLICHSIELSLKCFLCLCGKNLLEVADSGHRLDNILFESLENNLIDSVTIEGFEIDEIKKASNYYVGKLFEYPAVGEALKGYKSRPDMRVLIAVAEKLVSGLKEASIKHSE